MKNHHVTSSIFVTLLAMVWDGVRAGQLTPFDWIETGGDSSDGDSFYEGRLPVHSNDASFTTFTMDPQTGAYTFGYDTGGGEHQSYRVETRSPDGTVTGRYGYVDPEGVLRIVDYVADRRGYRPKITTRYPVSRTTSFIGPIPSPILQEESRLKTRKIPFATPLVTASLFTNQIVSIGDVDLASISSSISGSRADTLPPFPLFDL
ncbi:Cuticle protein 6 [Daphnia sinensis]|uniref:Cuticle protein 6 n=1 Tax=Daphnia sinensis TaxID=1820382 RepID=A0AAD5L6R6_9CRUS|nr:Cuticle protein 6 [Daphnia sinensis]